LDNKKKVEKKPKDPVASKSTEIDGVVSKVKDPKKKKLSGKGTPGILCWDGKGNIPFPNVWTMKPDGSKQ
jgi:hypothetical protein